MTLFTCCHMFIWCHWRVANHMGIIHHTTFWTGSGITGGLMRFDAHAMSLLCEWCGYTTITIEQIISHDDVIQWTHFSRYWPFVRGIHRSPVNSPHKGQWRGALMFSLICARINGWVNNRVAGDLGRHLANYDVIVMCLNLLIRTMFTYARHIRLNFQ